jgi:hypothetical protein
MREIKITLKFLLWVYLGGIVVTECFLLISALWLSWGHTHGWSDLKETPRVTISISVGWPFFLFFILARFLR